MDQEYLSKNASQSFNHSSSSCYKAAKTVIKDIGGKIQKEKKKKLKFSSNRFHHSRLVTVSESGSTASEVQNYHKFYVGVKGNKSRCVVTIFKYRVWINNQEANELNENFVKPRVFEPFFNDLKSQLEDTF